LHRQFICRHDTHSAQEAGSLSWGCVVMSLQFTYVRCFASLQTAEASCETCVQIVLLLGFIA